MLTVETRHATDPGSARRLDTDGLRRAFHAGGLFAAGQIRLVYTHYDRMILGGAVPGGGILTLDHVAETGTAGFLDRRELAVVNLGDRAASRRAGRRTIWSGATSSTSAWQRAP
jgi:4-deoxy-L-threo-5-hexosulose-uronate ketol-isomerase